MPVEIPSEHAETLTSIVQMGEERFAILLHVLLNETASADPMKVAERTAEHLESSDFSNSEDLVDAVVQMVFTKKKMGADVPELLDVVIKGIEEATKVPFSEDEKQTAVRRFGDLIDPKTPLVRSLKAHDALMGHACTYLRSKVMTDIRPVFHEGEITPFSDYVTAHTLQITYLEDGQRKTFYVALDAKDLKELRATVERAQSKNDSVESTLGGFGLREFIPEHS